MRKLQIAILTAVLFFTMSCTTSTTDKSYQLGAANQFEMTLNYIASKEALRNATIYALNAKKWTMHREGDAIRAKIDHGGVSGRLLITFENDAININSKGSNIDGEPIVPLRLIDNLNKVIRKQLIKPNNSI